MSFKLTPQQLQLTNILYQYLNNPADTDPSPIIEALRDYCCNRTEKMIAALTIQLINEHTLEHLLAEILKESHKYNMHFFLYYCTNKQLIPIVRRALRKHKITYNSLPAKVYLKMHQHNLAMFNCLVATKFFFKVPTLNELKAACSPTRNYYQERRNQEAYLDLHFLEMEVLKEAKKGILLTFSQKPIAPSHQIKKLAPKLCGAGLQDASLSLKCGLIQSITGFLLNPHNYSHDKEILQYNKYILANFREEMNATNQLSESWKDDTNMQIALKIRLLHANGFKKSEFDRIFTPIYLPGQGLLGKYEEEEDFEEDKPNILFCDSTPIGEVCLPCVRMNKLQLAANHAIYAFPLLQQAIKPFLSGLDNYNLIADLTELIEDMDMSYEDPYKL